MKTLLFLLLCYSAIGQTITYTAHNNDIINPERGFYHHTETHSNNYTLLNQNTLNSYRNENISLILRVFYLEDFIGNNSTISQAYLNNMQTDFDRIRNAGLKVIIRFAYTDDGDVLVTESTNIYNHILQLKPVLDNNVDVIYCFQAGFIGHWGEWYRSFNYGIGDNLTSVQVQQRREVLNMITGFFPHDRQVQIRTPYYKKQIFNTTTPIAEPEAYTGVNNKTRIGHHNDCFLANSDDYGTFNNQSDRDYLEDESDYTVVGGETCNLNTQYSNCANALDKLDRYSFDYLNIDYNTQVLDSWEDNGCFNGIKNKLGYRFELVSTVLSPSSITINIRNSGFGHLVNKRDVYLMFKNTNTGAFTSVLINTDPRFWLKNELITLSNSIPGLPVGVYDVYLSLPDQYLDDNRYAIQFANSNVFDPLTGLNNLNSRFEVTVLGTVEYNLNANDYKIEMYDLTGKRVNNDVKSLSSGVYIAKYIALDSVLTKKIFVK